MYVLVSTFSKTFDDMWLMYCVPELYESIQIWNIIEVPLKDNIELAIVLEIYTNLPSNINDEKVKSIISVKNNSLFLQSYRIQLLQWIAQYYFTPLHNAVWIFFPKNLLEKVAKEKLPNITEIKKPIDYTYKNTLILSEKQSLAYNQIQQSKNNKILFYGLTWSGKTEIYSQLIQDTIEKWQQVLLLIPEIILSHQLFDKITQTFWDQIFTINSSVSEAKKTQYWIDINNGNAKIILWTRSALFYPYNNLWMIIIDEEHDNSYISDSSPRYNSIEVAEKITDLNGSKLILASGTPSINSMYRAIKGKYELVNLLEVYNKKNPE